MWHPCTRCGIGSDDDKKGHAHKLTNRQNKNLRILFYQDKLQDRNIAAELLAEIGGKVGVIRNLNTRHYIDNPVKAVIEL